MMCCDVGMQMEEMEGDMDTLRDEFTTATAKHASVASTVVDHDDRANVLQFKLQG